MGWPTWPTAWAAASPRPGRWPEQWGQLPVGGLNYARSGANLRMTEFPGRACWRTQLTRLEEQSRRREQNAAYLTGLLPRGPRHHPGDHVRRVRPECVSSLHVAV